MRWCIFVCLSFNQAKTTDPISIKCSTKMANIPKSDAGIFPF